MSDRKIIILVPELEKRPPQKGEIYLAHWQDVEGLDTAKYPLTVDCIVYRVHEVKIPEGATDIGYSFWNRFGTTHNGTITLPQPPKKVKKWQWEIQLNGAVTTTTKNHFSEHGMAEIMGRLNTANMQWCKIPESMREFDE